VLAVGARFSEQASSLTLRRGHVTRLCDGGFRISGESDERDFETLERVEQRDDFSCFAAVRYREHYIATRNHAEIAVQRFGRMQKNDGVPVLERVAEIFCQRYRIAHTGDDNSALAREKEIDSAVERRVEARENVLNGLRFDAENAAGSVLAHEEHPSHSCTMPSRGAACCAPTSSIT